MIMALFCPACFSTPVRFPMFVCGSVKAIPWFLRGTCGQSNCRHLTPAAHVTFRRSRWYALVDVERMGVQTREMFYCISFFLGWTSINPSYFGVFTEGYWLVNWHSLITEWQVAAYHYSAVLYLSERGDDFQDGEPLDLTQSCLCQAWNEVELPSTCVLKASISFTIRRVFVRPSEVYLRVLPSANGAPRLVFMDSPPAQPAFWEIGTDLWYLAVSGMATLW